MPRQNVSEKNSEFVSGKAETEGQVGLCETIDPRTRIQSRARIRFHNRNKRNQRGSKRPSQSTKRSMHSVVCSVHLMQWEKQSRRLFHFISTERTTLCTKAPPSRSPVSRTTRASRVLSYAPLAASFVSPQEKRSEGGRDGARERSAFAATSGFVILLSARICMALKLCVHGLSLVALDFLQRP